MPTIDRRPRRRLVKNEIAAEATEELIELARSATPADWDAGLRRRLVRALVNDGKTHDIAVGISRVYERRPELIPMRRPSASLEQG